MDKSELLKTLENVHAELAGTQSVDEEMRRLLTTLTEDLQRLSEQSDKASAENVEPPSAEMQDLAAQVQDLVLQFETDHPRLTTALNQVAGALANLGI